MYNQSSMSKIIDYLKQQNFWNFKNIIKLNDFILKDV